MNSYLVINAHQITIYNIVDLCLALFSFGFVSFLDIATAEEAKRRMDETELKGRQIRIVRCIY